MFILLSKNFFIRTILSPYYMRSSTVLKLKRDTIALGKREQRTIEI